MQYEEHSETAGLGVKPSIHPPVGPITSQHEERWGEVGSPPLGTPSLLVAALSKDSFLLWHGKLVPGYRSSRRSPWWHYLDLTIFAAWALAQASKKSRSITVFVWLEHLYGRPAYEVEPTGTQGPASHAFLCGWPVHSPGTKESECLQATDNVWGVMI